MESKVCVVCSTYKSTASFYYNYRENKQCKIRKTLKRYYNNKDKLSNLRKIYCEKHRDVLLAKSELKHQNK